MTNHKNKLLSKTFWVILVVGFLMAAFSAVAGAVVNPQSDGVGVEGKISAPPPTSAPTISNLLMEET
jgi:hypothetical protein